MPDTGNTVNTRAPLVTMFRVWCCLCLVLFCLPAAASEDQVADDTLVKAAFIYNFAKFTRWPSQSWNGPKAPLNLCTTGKDALISNLGRLNKETVGGRPVTISTFTPGAEASACHILYIAASEHRHFTRIIQQTRDAPVLTISEIGRFAAAGGIIQLYHDQQRIRFKINLDVARSRGLSLSASLLDLAELVDTRVIP